MRDGRWLVGMGVTTAFYPVYQFPASARATLKADGTGEICLVLLDLVMPDTGGLAVLSAMRTLPRKPPAIVQTAHGSIDAAITAMRAGAVDFVVKPVSGSKSPSRTRSRSRLWPTSWCA